MQPNDNVEISDDLYDESKYGYFASAEFHARLRKMNAAAEERPGGIRARRRWIEKKLGCKYSDFMTFVESIVDDEGFSYVPTGDGGGVGFGMAQRPKQPTFIREHHISFAPDGAEIMKRFFEALASLGEADRQHYCKLQREGKEDAACDFFTEKTGVVVEPFLIDEVVERPLEESDSLFARLCQSSGEVESQSSRSVANGRFATKH